MLTRVQIQNFKCLQHTEVELGPFNVLIGTNDSGKTSFLQAVGLLANDQFGNLAPVVWERKTNRSIVLEAWGVSGQDYHDRLQISPADGAITESVTIGKEEFDTVTMSQDAGGLRVLSIGNYRIPLTAGQRPLAQLVAMSRMPESGLEHYATVASELQSSEIFQLNPDAMRSQAQATAGPVLDRKGGNLAAVLHAMLSGPDRQTVLDLESKLHDAIPTLKGVSTPLASVPVFGSHEIEFTLSGGARPPVTIPCSHASDGAMLLTGFLAIAYGNTPRRLLIEEPENGFHPSRLSMVIEILRKISTGEIGNQPRQVILTTHSPLLLNFVQPEEVKVFRRDEKQGTKVDSMDKLPNIARLRGEFAPGELWYLFGEEDLVKGKAS
jgi:predicted ATPase